MRSEPDDILRRLRPLLRQALPDADIDTIGPNTTPDDVIGWDSMAHVTLMASIEEAFAIMFTPQQITDFSMVGDLVALIARKMKDSPE